MNENVELTTRFISGTIRGTNYAHRAAAIGATQCTITGTAARVIHWLCDVYHWLVHVRLCGTCLLFDKDI